MAEHSAPLVALEAVSRTFGSGENRVRALDEISLSIFAHEFVAIVGPSGSGKSSLLAVLGLIDAPSSGRHWFKGAEVPWRSSAEIARLRRASIGFIFQYFNLLPSLTALENVMLTALLNNVKPEVAEARAEDLLRRVGLEKRRLHKAGALSGGEMQRVAVCRAVIHEPELIVADEPTGNLDSKSGEVVLELLGELSARTTIVMATHNARALEFVSRTIELKDGLLVARS